MARQTLTAAATDGPWPSGAVTITGTAANATDKEQCLHSDRLVLIARNSGATPRVVTITGVQDPTTKRTADLTATVPAGAQRMFGPFHPNGFKQTDGMVYFEAAHAEVIWTPILR